MKEPKWLSNLDARCSLETKQLLAHVRELREALDKQLLLCCGSSSDKYHCNYCVDAAALLTRQEPPKVGSNE